MTLQNTCLTPAKFNILGMKSHKDSPFPRNKMTLSASRYHLHSWIPFLGTGPSSSVTSRLLPRRAWAFLINGAVKPRWRLPPPHRRGRRESSREWKRRRHACKSGTITHLRAFKILYCEEIYVLDFLLSSSVTTLSQQPRYRMSKLYVPFLLRVPWGNPESQQLWLISCLWIWPKPSQSVQYAAVR